MLAIILLVLLIIITFLKIREYKNETYEDVMIPGVIMYISSDYRKFVVAYTKSDGHTIIKNLQFRNPKLNHDKGGRVYLFKNANDQWDFK